MESESDFSIYRSNFSSPSSWVILWNYQLLNIGGNDFFTVNSVDRHLKDGDEGELFAYWIGDSGEPKVGNVTLSWPPTMLPIPGDHLSFIRLTSDKLILTIEGDTPTAGQSWEVYDNGLPVTATWGRSSGLHLSVFVPSSVPAPTDLSIEKMANGGYKIDWTPTPGSSTMIAIKGGTETIAIPPQGTQPPFITPPLASPYYTIGLAAVVNGARSVPLQGSFYNGVSQSLVECRSFPSLSQSATTLDIQPGDMAMVDSTSTLIALSRNGDGTFLALNILEFTDNTPPKPRAFSACNRR